MVVADVQDDGSAETVRSIQSAGGTAAAIHTDVTDASAVDRMIKTAVETYGRLDILFNNAGMIIKGTVLDVDEESFDRIFAVNVKGVFLGCKAAIPIMLSQGGGVILNTASQMGTVGFEESSVYPATKGAVIQMTRCLALDHATDGIRVNALCPGPIDTPMNLQSSHLMGDVAEDQKRLIDRTPLARKGTAEEMANVAAFLCSDESSFVTGAAILADGGWTAR